ncbi:MAG: hypothetical protein ACRDFX_13555, partial [Chloroflexota bacterium]
FLVQVISNNNVKNVTGVPVPRHGTLRHRLSVVLSAALGSSDRGVRRFTVTSIVPDPSNGSLRRIGITWSINNDVGAGTIGNGAAIDVYAMLRNLYSSHLSVGSVRLIGTYPMRSGSRRHEATVMRLGMNHKTATVIAGNGWSTLDASAVWPLVNRYYVSSDFQPQTGG